MELHKMSSEITASVKAVDDQWFAETADNLATRLDLYLVIWKRKGLTTGMVVAHETYEQARHYMKYACPNAINCEYKFIGLPNK